MDLLAASTLSEVINIDSSGHEFISANDVIVASPSTPAKDIKKRTAFPVSLGPKHGNFNRL